MVSGFVKVLFILIHLGSVLPDCYTPPIDNPFQIPKPAPRSLDYCEWYNKQTCCTDIPNSLISFQGGPCEDPSSSCIDALKMYLCRFCSPHFSDYIDSYGKFRVCGNFADTIYSHCKGSQIEYGAQCRVVGDHWKNGKDFIENVYNEIYAKDNKDCFNAAQRFSPLPSLLLATSSLLFVYTVLVV